MKVEPVRLIDALGGNEEWPALGASLPARKFKARLDAYAGAEFVRKSILSIRDGAGVIERVLGGGKYRRVLEIGTYRGVGAAFMAQFVESVVTIDLRQGKMERDGQVFDRVALWTALGIDNITLHLVDGDVEKAEIISRQGFDFAFVDGNHSGKFPRRDFDMVKHCGAVLFHDYGADNGVTPLVDSLPKDEVEVMDIFALWTAKR